MRFDEIIHSSQHEEKCPTQMLPAGFSANQNVSYIELLAIAYKVYVGLKFVTDQGDFSVRILGKSSAYLSCMKARQRTPTQPVLFKLLRDTRLRRDLIAANKHFGKPYAKSLTQAHEKLTALVIRTECVLSDKPKRVILADEEDV